ncbi:hypothetical protein KIL84_013190 [Mauremys mutica]|uniref:Uncharacterized protein n=1 Tax=Mauremys mutica TaxID=74926 RepID=A0A9D4AU40_9SAUR|nr:hypothetical protein KIL84_013190 [Mauremys mutica]
MLVGEADKHNIKTGTVWAVSKYRHEQSQEWIRRGRWTYESMCKKLKFNVIVVVHNALSYEPKEKRFHTCSILCDKLRALTFVFVQLRGLNGEKGRGVTCFSPTS